MSKTVYFKVAIGKDGLQGSMIIIRKKKLCEEQNEPSAHQDRAKRKNAICRKKIV